MIELQRGDILTADAEALVNTVNCVGVMGRGVALQFRRAFPENYEAYLRVCQRGELHTGEVLVHRLARLGNPRYIINFPTKQHWKGASKLEYIESGLQSLVKEVKALGLSSIAVPPLGCGLGGLKWDDVRPRIVRAFEGVSDIRVFLYEPAGAPEPHAIVREARSPGMTISRAVLLQLMYQYLVGLMEPFVTLLEVHKLMYFMQESGQNLRLRYTKAPYGPYAENLRHALSAIDGHLITGYGDAQDAPDRQISIMAAAAGQASNFLASHAETLARLERVTRLIEGFETPYGMELLSTVHWVATHEEARDAESAIERVYAWNARKRMFPDRHLRLAWSVLIEQDWLNPLHDSLDQQSVIPTEPS